MKFIPVVIAAVIGIGSAHADTSSELEAFDNFVMLNDIQTKLDRIERQQWLRDNIRLNEQLLRDLPALPPPPCTTCPPPLSELNGYTFGPSQSAPQRR